MHKPIKINNKTPCIINTTSQNNTEIVMENSNSKYI